MGLGLAILICLAIFAIVGFMVFQARFAARHWRRVIREGDQQALSQLLDDTFEAWRRERPRRDTAPSDWRALLSAELVAADNGRIRVSVVVEPDVRVIDGQRMEMASATDVAERVAVRMVERLMYEVPYASFAHAQVDVIEEFRLPDGPTTSRCLLTTSATREQAAYADWEHGAPEEILSTWDTHRFDGETWPDPDKHAIIHPAGGIDADEVLRAAEDALDRGERGSADDAEADKADEPPGGNHR
ncbi:MAG: hypothetical protein O2924_00485 [Chloroflexi bacterium]|nr:hypothetical protein [Chloroflexota bacterium]MQC25341.1 hypothetical protein [Chloroflexota bacterium]MQC47457.1 hypothetical protein [Chloroflexota bacterium]